jgi:protoporphyrinogen oxidase/SAM-dependent methyltransferase
LYDKSIYGGIEMRVGIIGGGPGGLLTAYLLDRKSPTKLQTKIFEASNRVGGKLLTSHFECGSVPYEAGAAELYGYFHVGPDPLYNLVKSFGLSTKDMVGRAVVLDGQILGSPEDIKRHFGNKTWSAIKKFHKRGRKSISPLAYYESGYDDNNHPWARRSFQSILDKVSGRHARRYLKVAVHSDLATEPHETSALFGVENALMEHKEYVRLYSLEGGMERLTQALVANTTAQIALNSPVTRVKRNRFSTYNIYYRNRGNVLSEEFDAVVVALPNCCIPGVEWETKHLEGAMCKHHLHYQGIAHYLRLSLLFQKPFWRDAIRGSYFQSDSFGGCCIYDESSKLDTGNYGVLSWLLAGYEALLKSNLDDRILIEQALDSLPNVLSVGRELFLEGKVNRWVGTVSAPRLGQHIRGAKIRHLPDPKGHPGLFVVGDYLFDATVNGILDSADIATNLTLRHIGVKRRPFSLESPRINLEGPKSATLKKSYFRYYDGKNDYKDAFGAYFGHKHIIRQIKIIWGIKPPYRLLDSGSACGLSLDAFAKANVDAWGIENNNYIYRKTPARLRKKNILGDVRDLPFEDNYFDFVYDTCLCYLPEGDIDQAIRELHRVTRYGILHGSTSKDVERSRAERDEVFNGVKTLRTLSEWSELFVRNGFRLAINDEKILSKIWKLENEEGDAKLWYPNRQVLKYAFYTKEPKSYTRDLGIDLNKAGTNKFVLADSA